MDPVRRKCSLSFWATASPGRLGRWVLFFSSPHKVGCSCVVVVGSERGDHRTRR